MDTKTFGQRIKARRKELGLTARELAAQAHVVPTYISKLESKNILPSPKIIMRIGKTLKSDLLLDYLREKDPELFKALWLALTHAFGKKEVSDLRSHEIRKGEYRDWSGEARVVFARYLSDFVVGVRKKEPPQEVARIIIQKLTDSKAGDKRLEDDLITATTTLRRVFSALINQSNKDTK